MRKFFIAAAVAVISLIASGSSAQAAFEIALQEAGVNGGAITMVASGTDFQAFGIAFSGTYGDFDVTSFSGSSDNDGTLSDLLQSTTSVKNANHLNSGTRTLTLYVTQSNYTLPAGTPLRVESGMGGSVNNGTLGLTGIFQAFADKNNNPYGLTDFSNGPQNATANLTSFDTGSHTGLFARIAGNQYSITTVVTFTLSAGGKAGFQSHANVSPTPAPAGLVLALTGVPFLGLGAWIRRKVKAQVS